MPMPGLRFTTWPAAFFATKQRSRVSFRWRVMPRIASSHEISCHSREPGRRTRGWTTRWRFVMSPFNVTPFGQSVPRLIGWSGSPSMWTIVGVTFLRAVAEGVDDQAARHGTVGTGAARLGRARDLELAHLGACFREIEAERDRRPDGADRTRLQELPARDFHAQRLPNRRGHHIALHDPG